MVGVASARTRNLRLVTGTGAMDSTAHLRPPRGSRHPVPEPHSRSVANVGFKMFRRQAGSGR